MYNLVLDSEYLPRDTNSEIGAVEGGLIGAAAVTVLAVVACLFMQTNRKKLRKQSVKVKLF